MEIVQQAIPQSVLYVDDATHSGEARRLAVRWAEEMGMTEKERGSIAIAVTEMASNIVKHAKVGKIIFERIGVNGNQGLRVLALDKGEGIVDTHRALDDGFSTAGTSGVGLGAIRRLATEFDLYSLPGHGTCVYAEFWTRKKQPSHIDSFEVGVVSVPLQGEPVCGDGWRIRASSDRVWLMVVDGLGHGVYAAEAAREAERIFAETHSSSPAAILRDCHDALKKTRGAAAAIAVIDMQHKTLSFAGLGNISATLLTEGGSKGMASHNGTLGHQLHRIQEFSFPWNHDSVLVMHSDGLSSRWDLSEFRGIWKRHPSVIAGLLYRDFAKERDDVTVLVAKNQ